MDEKALLQRSRKRRIAILGAAICITAILILSWAVITEQGPTLSQKTIITARDMGAEWSGTKPESINSNLTESSNTAFVRMENIKRGISGTCILSIYETSDHANTSYSHEFTTTIAEPGMNSSLSPASVGDKAFLLSNSQDGTIWHQLLVMQKGNSIAWISLTTEDGQSLDEDLIVELAKIQAAKLN